MNTHFSNENGYRIRLFLVSVAVLTLSISFTNCASGIDPKNAANSQPKRIAAESADVNVSVLAFSPSGKTFAGANRVWDSETGRVVKVLDLPKADYLAAAFSADGKTLAIAFRHMMGQAEIQLWDTTSWTLKEKFVQNSLMVSGTPSSQSISGGVTAFALSHHGRTAVAVTDDGNITIWNTETGEKSNLKFEGVFTSVAVSPDGTLLAAGAAAGLSIQSGESGTNVLYKISLVDSRTGQKRHELTGETGARAFFSPDGKTLATGGKDGVIELWDASTGQLRKSLKGHEGDVDAISFSADGKLLASGGKDKTVKVWDIEMGTVKWPLSGLEGAVSSVAFAADGKVVASASTDKKINVWSLP